MMPRILVAGVGNIFLGDDAFGSETARRMLAREWPAHVNVTDFGIRGIDLAFALGDGYDAVILVDATPRGGAPGTVYVIEPDLAELESHPAEAAAIETHAMNPMRVLAVARGMGARLEKVLVVGCEPSPETVDPEGEGVMGLSAPAQAAVDEAIGTIEILIAQITAEGSRRQTQSTVGG